MRLATPAFRHMESDGSAAVMHAICGSIDDRVKDVG